MFTMFIIYHCLWCDFVSRRKKMPKHNDANGERCIGSGCRGVSERHKPA